MADFRPLVALQKLCHPQGLCQDPESSSDHPQTPELNPLPAHCMDRTHHPALAWEEQVPSDPITAGECPHGKPVPGGLSPLSPHHFYSGFWGQPRKGRQQDQLPQGAGVSGGNSWEASESQARAQLTEELFGKQSLSFHQLQKPDQGKCELRHQGKGNLFLPPLLRLLPQLG